MREVLAGDGEPPDLFEAVPQSPMLSTPFSDTTHPPSSDASIETTDDVVSGDDGRDATTFSVEGAKQPKKRIKGSDDEGNRECEPITKWRKKRARELDGDNDEDWRPHVEPFSKG